METSAIIELGAVVFGLTEVLKRLVPSKYSTIRDNFAPLMAVLLGGGMNVYLYGYTPENLIYGVILGLACTGLYKTVKS